jgi:hypothetical protein
MIRYNVNDPVNDCHIFSSANSSNNGYSEILRLKTTGSILSNRLYVPFITLNGVDLQTSLSTFLTSTSLATSSLTVSSLNTNGYDIDTRLKQLNYTDGYGFNASTFHMTSSGDYKYGHEEFWNITGSWGETYFLNYGKLNQGGFIFSCLNTSSNTSTVKQLLTLHPTNGASITNNLFVAGNLNVSTNSNITGNSTVQGNLAINGYTKKSTHYINTNFTMNTVSDIYQYYFVTNGASINFIFNVNVIPCDGIECVIRNLGAGIITVKNTCAIGVAIASVNQPDVIIGACESYKVTTDGNYWIQI